jgi:hypothetical protein
MAKTPRWTPQIDPSGNGPMMSVPRNADAPGRALAGAGRAVFQVGSFLSAEAKQAEEKTREYQREVEASKFRTERTDEFLETFDKISQTADPDERLAMWQQFQERAQTSLGTLKDEQTTAKATLYLNEDLRHWDSAVTQGVIQRRIDAGTEVEKTLLDQGRRLRSNVLYNDFLKDQVAAGAKTPEQATMAQEAFSSEILTLQGKDSVAADVTGMEYGPAVQYLNGPEAQNKLGGLDPQERQKFLDQQMGLLTRQQAQASQEARMADQMRTANGQRWLAKANQNQPIDLTAMWKEVDELGLDASVAKEVQAIVQNGPRTENDPATYAKLVEMQDAVQRGAAKGEDLKKFVFENASGLKRATSESALAAAANPFSMQTQAVTEAIQRMRGQFVRVQETDLQALLLSGATGESLKSAGDLRAGQLRLVDLGQDELEEWIGKNPDATRADILRRGREIQALIGQQSVEEQDRMIDAWQQGQEITLAGGERKKLTPETQRTQRGTEENELGTGGAEPAPVGLESVWGTLSVEERASAMRMIGRGVSASQILAALQGGK